VSVTQLSKASLYGVFNIFTVDFNDDSYANFHDNNHTNESHILLENISQRESELVNTQLKFFFVQTSENEDILSRHACSIESAARLHPNGLIFVLMRSEYVHMKKGSFNRLRTYTNIRFVHFNELDVYSSTTLSRLNETKRTQFIRYFTISHMSDFIRTALLYRYGGIYFDLDVIPLKTFSLFTNTVALETIDGVNVAVLAFEKQHLALDIQMDIQLTLVNNRLNAFCWNCVGPSALSDALKRVCDDKTLYIHSKDKCQQIDIQPSFVFYPIPYQVKKTKNFLKKISVSFV
jgi:lactosylceramide 4-alpha-galactosyltransferase